MASTHGFGFVEMQIPGRSEVYLDPPPVNGYHPKDPDRKIYDIFRKALNAEDIGKSFVRSQPSYNHPTWDWSWVPSSQSSLEKIQADASLLVSITDTLNFQCSIAHSRYNYKLNMTKNDGRWIAAEDFWRASQDPAIKPSLAPLVGQAKHATDRPEADSSKGVEICRMEELLRRYKVSKCAASSLSSKICTLHIQDFTFHPPDDSEDLPPSAAAAQLYVLPQNLSPDPHEVLGLRSCVTNKALIFKRYRELALLHHPDKGGDAESFKRLHQAYEVLVKEFSNASSESSLESELKLMDELAEFYAAAAKRYKRLIDRRESFWAKGYKSLLDDVEKFRARLQTKLARAEKAKPIIQELLVDLLEKSQQFTLCCQLKMELDTRFHVEKGRFQGTLRDLEPTKRRFADMLDALRKYAEEFDLDNQRKTWKGRHAYYREANAYYLDKFAGIGRLLLEINVAESKRMGASKKLLELNEAHADFEERMSVHYTVPGEFEEVGAEKAADEPFAKESSQAASLPPPDEFVPLDAMLCLQRPACRPKRGISHSQMLEALIKNVQVNITAATKALNAHKYLRGERIMIFTSM